MCPSNRASSTTVPSRPGMCLFGEYSRTALAAGGQVSRAGPSSLKQCCPTPTGSCSIPKALMHCQKWRWNQTA